MARPDDDLDPQLAVRDPAWRDSPLWSEDLAPVPAEGRTWSMGHIAAIWVGMAVCIPTYMLAASMLQAGLRWGEALVLIGLANAIIAVPMVLNGHAGVRYGIPFPVLGRAAFGTRGVHLPALARALVACGWFGIQTWVGGVALYAMGCALTGETFAPGLVPGKFLGFAGFWLINVWFIWKGTESIKRLEAWAAPILLALGLGLIGWGVHHAGSFGAVLAQSAQLRQPALAVTAAGDEWLVEARPLRGFDGVVKAREARVTLLDAAGDTLAAGPWKPWRADGAALGLRGSFPEAFAGGAVPVRVSVRFRGADGAVSSAVEAALPAAPGQGAAAGGGPSAEGPTRPWGTWLYWLTGMVGFWATMSLSIADITRYAHRQRDQVAGQFLGLPGTMVAYAFIGIFVTCAAVGLFPDVLVAADAPWDPASLLARLEHPVVLVVAQAALLVATLSTNIAANVIAPANAFANLAPRRLGFRGGGLVAAGIGVALMPWWLVDRIAAALLVISAFFGPILGVMLADYFTVRRLRLDLGGLYDPAGPYAYRGGVHPAALAALAAGTLPTLLGYLVPGLGLLYDGSWFIGFGVAWAVYAALARRPAV